MKDESKFILCYNQARIKEKIMKRKLVKKLKSVFELYPEIKLVYLFGSRATEKEGPLSDHDFAFYSSIRDKKRIHEIKLKLLNKISNILKTDNIDVVCLNTTKSPELKYNIIKEGKLIFEKEPFKVLVEPKILTEYFDFRLSLRKYNLTKT